MPENFMDMNFPRVEGKPASDSLKVILDYLYSLQESLRYTLNNLDTSNFNEKEWATVQNGILTIAAKQAQIIADEIDLTGFVTFANLSTPGQTTIDGGNITAGGTITGNHLRGGTIGIGENGGGYNFTVDADGNVVLNGNITWGSANSPVKVQYSVNGSTAWHSTYTTGDMFARYSYDGGETWTPAMKVVAVDGSDATVPGYITSTVIGPNEISASKINGNMITVQSPDAAIASGFSLKGYYGETLWEMLRMWYYQGDEAEVVFDSPAGAKAFWNFPKSAFYGAINFSNATVTGLPYAVFD